MCVYDCALKGTTTVLYMYINIFIDRLLTYILK